MYFWKNLRIGRRITVGFASVVLLTVACAITGWLGVSRLDEALDYVTGPAWSTADGAMEGSIGIEAQMLAVERFVSGTVSKSEAQELLDEGAAMEDDALGRMQSAGLVDSAKVVRLNELREDYHQMRQALWEARESDTVTLDLRASYMTAANQLLGYVEEIEALGDAQVEGRIETIRTATDASYVVIATMAVVAIIAAAIIGTLIVRNVTRPIARAIAIAERIGRGDLSGDIDVDDGHDEASVLLRALAKMQQDMRDRIAREQKQSEDIAAEQRAAEVELERVLADAIRGRLRSRLRVESMKGFLAVVGAQVNQMLDAIVTPLSEAADYLSRISRGEIPSRITHAYEGEFDVIKSNLNASIEAIGLLIEDTRELATAVRRGDLKVRVDASRHQGAYGEIVSTISDAFQGIVEPIQETQRVMGSLAKGDLTESVRGNYQGEFARLQTAVNASIEQIRDLINQIRSGAEVIRSSGSEISAGNVDLSARTETQAASVQQSSTSIANLTQLIRSNALQAREAEKLSQSTVSAAKEATEVVGNAISSMNEIDRASKEIADIINVVDDIAFQTNLLALNAAIEAARAGEQGRGFAVVAGEVRNLAQRSAEAARQIKDLIEASVGRSEEGSALVRTTGATFEKIAQSIIAVSSMIGGIAAEADAQYAGIEQASRALADIEQATQRNAALVEEVAATSESLNQQALGLHQVVESFRT